MDVIQLVRALIYYIIINIVNCTITSNTLIPITFNKSVHECMYECLYENVISFIINGKLRKI